MLSIGQLSIAMLVDMSINMLVYTRLIWQSVYWPTYRLTCLHYQLICQLTYQHSISRLSLNTSANMLTESQVTDVGREIDRGSANMSIEYPPVVSTNTRLRGTQITQDPLKAVADNTSRNLDYFGYHKS